MGVSKKHVEAHRNVRQRVLVGQRTASGLHFADLLALNRHNHKCRRIVIYHGSLCKQRLVQQAQYVPIDWNVVVEDNYCRVIARRTVTNTLKDLLSDTH